eukprot:4043290-Alexandrium_andersonii.AAC.1
MDFCGPTPRMKMAENLAARGDELRPEGDVRRERGLAHETGVEELLEGAQLVAHEVPGGADVVDGPALAPADEPEEE